MAPGWENLQFQYFEKVSNEDSATFVHIRAPVLFARSGENLH